MPYKIELRPLAAIEVLEAYDWYELQREGLGGEFLQELEHFYASLKRNPNIYTYFQEPVRQGKMNRFPYVGVYEVFESNIVIYSFFMSSQDPNKKRMG